MIKVCVALLSLSADHNKPVFAVTGLALKYSLTGIVCHGGGIMGGHYTSYFAKSMSDPSGRFRCCMLFIHFGHFMLLLLR